MKNFLLLLSVTLISAFSFGQIKIVHIDDQETMLNESIFEVIGEKTDQTIKATLRVINTSDDIILVKYRRFKEAGTDDKMEQLCNNLLCYPINSSDMFTTQNYDTLYPNVPAILEPAILPDGDDVCTLNTYYVIDEDGDIIDFVSVRFGTQGYSCELSNKDFTKSTFKMYPNPAQDVVTLNGEALQNGGTVVFTDALGKEVKRQAFNSTTTTIGIDALKRGVYFVSVYNKQGVKSSVHRLIKQ